MCGWKLEVKISLQEGGKKLCGPYLTLVAIAANVHGQTAGLQGRCYFILPLGVVHVCNWNSINSHNLIVHTQLAKLRWAA